MQDAAIRVMVVDDSLLFRSLLSNILKEDESIDVVGTAMNGRAALAAIPHCNPDVITLDVEMPEMDGITTLKLIRERHPAIQVIMVSATTFEGAHNTLKALELGAHDFFLKSGELSGATPQDQLHYVKSSILSKIKRAYRERTLREPPPGTGKPADATGPAFPGEVNTESLIVPGKKPLCLNIACEETYLGHLLLLTRHLDLTLQVPVIYKIMVPEVFLKSLNESLGRGNSHFQYHTGIPDPVLRPGHVYLLDENQKITLQNSDGGLQATVERLTQRSGINDHLSFMQEAKMQHTPIMLISNDPLGDGVAALTAMTETGFPTLLATKCQDRFKKRPQQVANLVVDISQLPGLIKNLYGVGN